MKPFSACPVEESFLLAAIGNMLAVLGDVADGVQSEFLMLGCDVSTLVLARPISHFLLRLSLDECCFVFAQLLLPDKGHARRYFRRVQHRAWTRERVWLLYLGRNRV